MSVQRRPRQNFVLEMNAERNVITLALLLRVYSFCLLLQTCDLEALKWISKPTHGSHLNTDVTAFYHIFNYIFTLLINVRFRGITTLVLVFKIKANSISTTRSPRNIYTYSAVQYIYIFIYLFIYLFNQRSEFTIIL
jgi:hypothetical protein